MEIKKIKDKALKKMHQEQRLALIQEAKTLQDILDIPTHPLSIKHRKHIVNYNGADYIVFDALTAARSTHQSGRGCYRHGFARESKDYSLFRESDSGNYVQIAC